MSPSIRRHADAGQESASAAEQEVGPPGPAVVDPALAERPAEERAAVLGALSGSAGNAAVSRRLARDKKPPETAEITDLWVEKWKPAMKDQDCGTVARRMARLLGGESNATPSTMLKDDLVNASRKEEREARSRGLKIPDKVVTSAGRDRFVVYDGMAGSVGATIHPLLPGMMIYTAENLAWRDKENKLYRWFDRHMAMYAGGGIVFENFRTPTDPRNVTEDVTAYGSGSLFSVGLALYDPFDGLRKSSLVDEFIADMLMRGAGLSVLLKALLDTVTAEN